MKIELSVVSVSVGVVCACLFNLGSLGRYKEQSRPGDPNDLRMA